MPELFMVFDVESIGLHGGSFAYGYVVIDRAGHEVASGGAACKPERAYGFDEDWDWVAANCPELPVTHGDPQNVRGRFWRDWMDWKAKGAVLAADCPWPVEARFLIECINVDPVRRKWDGPYPLIDVASVRLAAGLDPLGTDERRPDELPIHDPLADARQSARLLIEALNALR
jgi:hypothetical protein